MANKIQIKRGQESGVEKLSLAAGELAVTLDTGKLYCGDGSGGKYHLNPPTSASETAEKLKTAREFKLTGDVTSDIQKFDGSQNLTLTTSLPTVSGLTAGTYTKLTVTSKGLVTAGTTLSATDIPSLSKSKITDLGTAAGCNTGTASGNVVVIGSDGKIPTSIIPDLAITDTFVVASETAMLALSAQKGDVAVRTDENKTYILKATPASTLSNWQLLQTPTSPVQSVNGKTGAVTLDYTNVRAEKALSGSTAKSEPADNDGIIILDSADSNGTKKLLWSVIKSKLAYTLTKATASALGGVKLSSTDTSININDDGVITVGDIDGGTF